MAVAATVVAVLADAPWWMFVFGTTPILAASCFVQLISTHNAMHTPVFVHKHANRAWPQRFDDPATLRARARDVTCDQVPLDSRKRITLPRRGAQKLR